MLIEKIKNIKSGKKELRRFGIIIGLVLAVLGGLFLWRERNYYYYFFFFSIVFLFLGLVLPILLKPFHKIWMSFTILIGWLTTKLILIILFYMIVTPIGLISRLFGKDFLNLKTDISQKSYWNYRKPKEFKKSYYEKQF